MKTLARLEELKRNLAQLERKRGPPPKAAGGRHERGREADRPADIPPRGWMDIMWRAWGEISEANLFLIAGGVTYAILLALFPGLAALVSLYGLVLDASQIEKQVGALSEILPAETQQLLAQQLHKLVEASSGALGIGAAVGVVLALWSASRGMSGLITALNIAYEEKERRGFFKLNLLALGLTLAQLIGGIVIIALVAVLPAALQFLDVGGATKSVAPGSAVAPPYRHGDAGAGGPLSIRAGSGEAAVAMGLAGRHCGNNPVGDRFHRLHDLRRQLQQLR